MYAHFSRQINERASIKGNYEGGQQARIGIDQGEGCKKVTMIGESF